MADGAVVLDPVDEWPAAVRLALRAVEAMHFPGRIAFTFYGGSYELGIDITPFQGFPAWVKVGYDTHYIFNDGEGRWCRNMSQGDFSVFASVKVKDACVVPPNGRGWRYADTPDDSDPLGDLPEGAVLVRDPEYMSLLSRLTAPWSRQTHSAMNPQARLFVQTVLLCGQRLAAAGGGHGGRSGRADADPGRLLLDMLDRETADAAGPVATAATRAVAVESAVPRLPQEMWLHVLGMIAEVDMLYSSPGIRTTLFGPADDEHDRLY
eukprot:m.468474 g.468474  ORF g.468474 m.468474 type:complete len:265 (+) comp27526_c0_seq1:178-972(+)